MQLGLFLFYGGYLAGAMLNLSAVLTVFHRAFIPLVMFCEFMGYLGLIPKMHPNQAANPRSAEGDMDGDTERLELDTEADIEKSRSSIMSMQSSYLS